MKGWLFLLGILLIGSIFAQNYFSYEIVGDKALTKISFYGGPGDYIVLPSDANVLDFSGPIQISEDYGEKRVIFEKEGTAYLEYVTNDYVQKSGKNFFFIVRDEWLQDSFIQVVLPLGAILKKDFITFPKNPSMTTNGENIILNWENGEKEIFVAYQKVGKNFVWLYVVLGVLVGGGLFVFFLRKNRKDLTSNLVREEKAIVDYLIKEKEAWTKEIMKNLNISKVKLSRKLRNLEEKGLIKKIPYGNENKIILVKK